MPRPFHFISFQLVLLLAACAGAETESDLSTGAGDAVEQADMGADEPALAEIELCDAADYRPLIGSMVGEAALEPSSSLRVFGVHDIVTQDYVPQRTNVVYDEDGKITRAYCG